MKAPPYGTILRDVMQLDLFGSRTGVSRKELREGWTPAGYEEQPERRPFARGRRARGR